MNLSVCSSAWLERLLGVQEVGGSNPLTLTSFDLSGWGAVW